MSGATENNAVIAGLYSLYRACNGSTKRHIPKTWLRKKLAQDVGHFTGDMLKKLRKLGYADIHKGRARTIHVR